MRVGRVMAVDPGEKRIGIALSDPTSSIAAPLTVINHIEITEDCRKIVQLAAEHNVDLILVGQALGMEGEETRQVRHAQKIGEKIRSMSSIPVRFWDESNSTQIARQIRIETGAKRKARSGHMDDRAAAVILQGFLDSQHDQENE